MLTPPGTSEQTFRHIIRDFTGVVGEAWVFTAPEDLETYRDDFSPYFGIAQDPRAATAVAPDNVEQVQEIVRIANRYRIPLWVISTGKNYGYGGPAPLQSGSVVLDLKRMNRILDVDEASGYALVEPGVSFFDLHRYIRKHGIKLWLDVPGPGWGSVIGNTIERGIGYTPYGERFDYQCGMEVVLPDGKLVRTGMGALPGSRTWQQFKWALGPHLDGLFSQTNLGIVTKMGLWLMPEPEVFRSAAIRVPRNEDIVQVLDRLKPLRMSGMVANAGTITLDQSAGFDKPGGWTNWVGFYGMEEVVELYWKRVRQAYAVIPGVEFDTTLFTPPYNPDPMNDFTRLLAGVPNLRGPLVQGFHWFLFLQHVVSFSGAEVWQAIQSIDRVFQQYGRRYFGGLIHVPSPRSLVLSVGGLLKRGDQQFNEQTLALSKHLLKDSAGKGWGIYRAPVALMDEVMAAYDYNDHALLHLNERLKDALDPNGILAPGKNGIWPKQERKA